MCVCVSVCHDLQDLANWQAEFITTLVLLLYIKIHSCFEIHFVCAPGLQTRHDSIVLPQKQYRNPIIIVLSFCSRYRDCFPVYSKIYISPLLLSYRCFLRYMYIVILTQVALIRISCTIVSSWIICQIIYFLSVYWSVCVHCCVVSVCDCQFSDADTSPKGHPRTHDHITVLIPGKLIACHSVR